MAEVFYKKGVLKIFAKLGKHEHRKTSVPNYLFNRVCKTQAWNFIKNETPAQVFFVDFEILQTTSSGCKQFIELPALFPVHICSLISSHHT